MIQEESVPDKREVAAVGCSSYERGLVRESVARTFELLGGPGAFVSPGQSVFVKVNGLIPAAPEKAVTTHPEVVRAVVEQIMMVTPRVTIGDSPGGVYNKAMLTRVYQKCGFKTVAEETGASLNWDFSVVQKKVPEAKLMKSFTLCDAMVEADRLVSVSKFKTHLQMNITGAIKNVFGAVPGLTKFNYHSKYNTDRDFSDLIVDVLLAARPSFHVIDAVEAMDGNGPRAGDVKKMEILAAGSDAFALDRLMMDLVGIPPDVNKPLAAAIERGLASEDSSGLRVLVDSLEKLRVEGFHLPVKKDISARIPVFLTDMFAARMSMRPRPDPAVCTACGKCVEICPRGAISIVDRSARVDLSKCIKCYCCHELCEHDAIELERPLLLRLANRIGG
jgi:uncharacterized protein (DUF362 family)/Pyruvate/2-oxoacid:ferredoxin oxidoreductase delta subunit